MTKKFSISRMPGKIAVFLCFFLLTLVLSVVHINGALYSLSFLEMVQYFHVPNDRIESVMRYNFLGICIGGLFIGALSDSFGRKKVLLIGLGINVLTSLGSAITHSIDVLISLRFIGGISEATGLILTIVIIFDAFSKENAAKITSLSNVFLGVFSISAPLIAGWVVQNYDWRINLDIIFGLSILSFIGLWILLKETNPVNKRIPFNFVGIFKGYFRIITSLRFISYTLLYKFAHVLLIVFAVNLSLIFMKFLKLPPEIFGYYQASTPAFFMFFSFISIKIIDLIGLEDTNHLGFSITLLGTASLLAIAAFLPNNTLAIIIAINIIISGGALMNGFVVKALSCYPHMKGSSMAMISTVEYLLTSRATFWTQHFFNGTILPVAIIVFVFTMMISILYAMINRFDKLFSSSRH